MTNEALTPVVTIAVSALLTGWVPLLEAIASSRRISRNTFRRHRTDEALPVVPGGRSGREPIA